MLPHQGRKADGISEAGGLSNEKIRVLEVAKERNVEDDRGDLDGAYFAVAASIARRFRRDGQREINGD